MGSLTEFDRPFRQIDAGHLSRLEVPGHERTPTTTTAADFEHTSSRQIHAGRNTVVKLNAEAIPLVGGFQFQGSRRLIMKTVVHECPVRTTIAARQKLVPSMPQPFAHDRKPEQPHKGVSEKRA